MDPKVPFGELTEQEVTEIDRPNAVGTLFEADVFMLQRASHEQLPAVEPNGPRGTDEPNDVMARIFRGGQRARIHAGRRLPKPRVRVPEILTGSFPEILAGPDRL